MKKTTRYYKKMMKNPYQEATIFYCAGLNTLYRNYASDNCLKLYRREKEDTIQDVCLAWIENSDNIKSLDDEKRIAFSAVNRHIYKTSKEYKNTPVGLMDDDNQLCHAIRNIAFIDTLEQIDITSCDSKRSMKKHKDGELTESTEHRSYYLNKECKKEAIAVLHEILETENKNNDLSPTEYKVLLNLVDNDVDEVCKILNKTRKYLSVILSRISEKVDKKIDGKLLVKYMEQHDMFVSILGKIVETVKIVSEKIA